MAGEKKGKAYEALVHVALQDLVAAKKLAGPLHWNVTPKGMSIEPDFMIGSDTNDPNTVLLLNHSNAAGNSHMKFWRNLGELVEAKTVLQNMPKVYCLTFGVIKRDLEPIQQHAFDQFVWVRQATHPWADDLDSFISSCVTTFPKGKDMQTQFMREELKNASPTVKGAYNKLLSILEDMLTVKSVALDRMWADHRARGITLARSPMNTCYRRGIAKLHLLPEPVAKAICSRSRANAFKGDDVFISFGLLKRVTGGKLDLADSEAIFAVKHLAQTAIAEILSKPIPEGMNVIRSQVMDIANIPVYLDILGSLGRKLENPENLFQLFKKQNSDPTMGMTEFVSSPKDVWSFRVILETFRYLNGNRRQAYGYAQMVTDIKSAVADPACTAWLKSKFNYDPTPLAASSEPVRRGLQDFLNRTRDGAVSDGQLGIVAWVLAQKLKQLSINWKSIAFDLAASWDSNALEARYLCHREFEPLVDLMIAGTKGVSFERVIVHSAFAEAAGVSGSGVTTVLKASDTLINWQSCSDAGRDHKKKELCGRAIGLRYHWNGKAFVPRSGVKKLILVIDGTWRQGDINALTRSGWDEIYYPDEMDQLAKAVV